MILDFQNIDSYQPLLAIGTRTGCVQIYNLSTGIQACQFSLHTYAVKGIEWVNLHAFISFCVVVPPSYGSSSSAAAQPIKNELSLVDISTGRVSPVKLTEDAPVEMVRISYLKQYFILVYKGNFSGGIATCLVKCILITCTSCMYVQIMCGLSNRSTVRIVGPEVTDDPASNAQGEFHDQNVNNQNNISQNNINN